MVTCTTYWWSIVKATDISWSLPAYLSGSLLTLVKKLSTTWLSPKPISFSWGDAAQPEAPQIHHMDSSKLHLAMVVGRALAEESIIIALAMKKATLKPGEDHPGPGTTSGIRTFGHKDYKVAYIAKQLSLLVSWGCWSCTSFCFINSAWLPQRNAF